MDPVVEEVSAFFGAHPRARAIAVEVARAVDALGPHTVRLSRSQVAFRRATGFAYLWRPGQYVRSDVPVVLTIALPHEVSHPRWKEVAHPASRVWMHHLELHSPSEVDVQVRGWLREAFEATEPAARDT